MPIDTKTALGSITASITAITSIIAGIVLFLLQAKISPDLNLVLWWLVSSLLAIAAATIIYSPPSLSVRSIFVLAFILQIPAFTYVWSERTERDTDTVLEFSLSPVSLIETELSETKTEVNQLKEEVKKSKLFWQGIAHLFGMGAALFACTAAAGHHPIGVNNRLQL